MNKRGEYDRRILELSEEELDALDKSALVVETGESAQEEIPAADGEKEAEEKIVGNAVEKQPEVIKFTYLDDPPVVDNQQLKKINFHAEINGTEGKVNSFMKTKSVWSF